MTNRRENLPHKHFGCRNRYFDIQSPEQQTRFIIIRDYIFYILSIFLAPFYCIGLLLKEILSIVIKLIKIVLKMLMCRCSADTLTNHNDSDSLGITIPAAPPNENEYTVQKHIKQPVHSKLVLCPNCEHLHYSSKNCGCKDCTMKRPRILKCLKFHNNDAQLLICPCVDCKFKRPTSEFCEHCVLVSQKLHIQAKTPADIEIRTRPKRKK